MSETLRILSWLRHGADLAREQKADKAKHNDVIWRLIEEAIETIDKLPDQDKRWLTSGFRSGGWGMVGMTASDLRELERIRFLSAMKPYDGPAGFQKDRLAETRAMDVLSWFRYFSEKRFLDMQKATVALARGGDCEAFHRVWAPKRRISPQAVSQFRQQVVGLILTGLAREFGIVKGPGLTFMETSIVE